MTHRRDVVEQLSNRFSVFTFLLFFYYFRNCTFFVPPKNTYLLDFKDIFTENILYQVCLHIPSFVHRKVAADNNMEENNM